jgi:hypothetical protein
MNRFFLLLFTGFFVLTGCKKTTPVALDKDKMVAIMIDLEYAKAATHGRSMALKDSMMLVYKQQICDIHGISKESLERDLEALERNQELLDEILRMVKDSLSIEK